jgi:hypothetical protein
LRIECASSEICSTSVFRQVGFIGVTVDIPLHDDREYRHQRWEATFTRSHGYPAFWSYQSKNRSAPAAAELQLCGRRNFRCESRINEPARERNFSWKAKR